MAHVLIVDDEQSICWGLSRLVRGLGHTAAVAPSAERALQEIETRPVNLIVLDVRLPGLDGLAAMRQFGQRAGPVPLIVMTAYGDLETAVTAVRNGAFEYLTKPFALDVAQRAIERALQAPCDPKPETAVADAQWPPHHLVGSSPPMQEIFKRIAVVAPTDACVHIRGESGTGKELVARAIHRYSRRASEPFIPVSIASLSPALAESELFGHVRGAFTGAEQSRRGLLQQADGGTIFLDEVADIPLSLQVKLLRVLEYGEVLPVGATQPIRSDFRLLSATHQSLRQRVTEGVFRQDLYSRLITFEIEAPPLRDRLGDLGELAQHFLGKLSSKNNCPRPMLAPEAMTALEGRPWYGNVRELRNALEHAMILARGGLILPEHLPPPTPAGKEAQQTAPTMLADLIRDWVQTELQQPTEAKDLYNRLLQVVEPPLLGAVLRKNRGQFLAAAKQLGLHRVTLKRKVSQYGKLAE